MLSSLSTIATPHVYTYKSDTVFRGIIWPYDAYGNGSGQDFFGDSIVANAKWFVVGAWGETTTWYGLQPYSGYMHTYVAPTSVTSGGSAGTSGSRFGSVVNPWYNTGTSSSDLRASYTFFATRLKSHPKNPTHFLIDGSGYKPSSTLTLGRLYYASWSSPNSLSYRASPYGVYTGYGQAFGIAKNSAIIVSAKDYGSYYGRVFIHSAPTNSTNKTIYYGPAPIGHKLGESVAIDYNDTEYWYAISTAANLSNTTIFLANSSSTFTTAINVSENIDLNTKNKYVIDQPYAINLNLRGNTLVTVTSSDVHVRNVLTHSESISSNGYYKITGFSNAYSVEIIDNLLYVGDYSANTYGGIYLYNMNNFSANATANVINRNDCDNQILNTGYKDGNSINRSADVTDYFGYTFAVVNKRIYIGSRTKYAANTGNTNSGLVYIYDNFGV